MSGRQAVAAGREDGRDEGEGGMERTLTVGATTLTCGPGCVLCVCVGVGLKQKSKTEEEEVVEQEWNCRTQLAQELPLMRRYSIPVLLLFIIRD